MPLPGNSMKKHTRKGFSIVEILLALAIVSVGITGATVLAFGSQDAVRDAGLSQDALYKVEKGLENAFADLQRDWNSLAASAVLASDITSQSTTAVLVVDETECVKRVESRADWDVPQRSQASSLISLFTSTSTIAALGGNCNTTPGTNDWDFPSSYGHADLSPNGVKGRDVDVVRRGTQLIAYFGSEHASDSNEDFWIIDATIPTAPTIISQIDIGDALGGGANGRLNSIVAAGNYVYGAAHDDTAQFVVIDVTDLNNPTVVATSTLSGVSGSAPEGKTIAYYNNMVYVGTDRTAGAELHIFDVSDPENPVEINVVGGAPLELNHNVEDMVVRDGMLYIASSADQCELMIIDASNPNVMTNPCPAVVPAGATVYNATGDEDGTAVYALGNRVYLGRHETNNPGSGEHELYVLDVTTPSSVSVLGSRDLGLGSNTQVEGISVTGPLVFLATTHTTAGFQVWYTGTLPSIVSPSSCDNTYNYSEKASAIDFYDNYGFVANESNQAFRVIYDDPSCTP